MTVGELIKLLEKEMSSSEVRINENGQPSSEIDLYIYDHTGNTERVAWIIELPTTTGK